MFRSMICSYCICKYVVDDKDLKLINCDICDCMIIFVFSNKRMKQF